MGARLQGGLSPAALRGGSRARGFTLVELVVVLAIVLALAGAVVPFLHRDVEESRRAEAAAACEAIGQALVHYEHDTGYPPTGPLGARSAAVLVGPGTVPALAAFAGTAAPLAEFLQQNSTGGPYWHGPYLETLGPDPWDRAFVVHAAGWYRPDERGWVLSAGPDGVLQTAPSDLTVSGDDIGMTVR